MPWLCPCSFGKLDLRQAVGVPLRVEGQSDERKLEAEERRSPGSEARRAGLLLSGCKPVKSSRNSEVDMA